MTREPSRLPSLRFPGKPVSSQAAPSSAPRRRIRVDGAPNRADASFEQALATVATQLSNVADDGFSRAMTAALGSLAELLGFDRSTLMAFARDGAELQVTHSWAAPGIQPAARSSILNSRLPWFTHEMRAGHIVSISSLKDVPDVAVREWKRLMASGLKSALGVPLLMEGSVIGAVTFGSFRKERHWPAELVSRLRLVGEMLGLAWRRHQYAVGLRSIAATAQGLAPARGPSGPSGSATLRQRALRLMHAENAERQRMAHVLHENIMQSLAAMKLMIESRAADLPATGVRAADLRNILHKLRQLYWDLQPPAAANEPLAESLSHLAGHVRRSSDLHVQVRMARNVEPVGDDIKSFLCDSVRKLLENAAAHARVHDAAVDVRRTRRGLVRLTVSDEGIGFQPESLDVLGSGGYGLVGLRERAELLGGSLQIDSSPGRGTRVVLTVPE